MGLTNLLQLQKIEVTRSILRTEKKLAFREVWHMLFIITPITIICPILVVALIDESL